MSTSDPIALRIIDANLNRAREALRVMEEYARFGLNDAELSAALKEARHALVAGVPEAVARQLLAHRATETDVGREIRTDAEYARSNAVQVVQAAAKRLAEALRSIEEYGKTVDTAFAVGMERLRYRAYELEQRLLLTARAVERFGGVRLYVLLTESLCGGAWLETAEAALRGGADCLQLREKQLSDKELVKRAKQLSDLCHRYDALCIVNDRPDIAAVTGADGVHLGQDDMSVASARRVLPSTAIVGRSTHTVDQVRQAACECPDYIAVGPMFDTPTKPQDRIAGPGSLAMSCACTGLPLVAVGGIDADNAGDVLAAAQCCLCVCTAVIAQRDAEQAARRLCSMIDASCFGDVSAAQTPNPR
ncbi:MAG: thiamine phosphate synthase [Planctomycetes bacterium]|nr:thiamine phosphate synthase [Planctomycetota bacterium]